MSNGLHTSPLFNGLSEAEMGVLSSFMTERRIDEGAAVFIENMPGESMYLLELGGIRISKMIAEGEEVTLAQLGPQDCFGEMALVEPGMRSVTARALKPTVLWGLKKSDFDQLCEKNPQLGVKLIKNILKLFSRRIRENDHEIRSIIHRVAQRA